MLELNYTKNKDLGLWEAEATLTLPPLTLTRIKADKSDLKYELRRAFSEVVEEIVEKAVQDED
jgi:hypothetical protein